MKVYQAMAAVMADLAKVGIGKDQVNQQQRFKYRGVDDVMNTLAPILAKHGLLIIPRVQDRVVTERESKSGGTIFHTVLRMEFDFVASEDGSGHTACVIGEAMDSGDKAANKAMSVAYKYAAFQAFCIPLEGTDPDAETHEVRPPPLPTHAEAIAKWLDAGDVSKALSIYSGLSNDDKVSAWGQLSKAHRERIRATGKKDTQTEVIQ